MRILALLLTLLMCAPAFAGTTDVKTGSALTYQIPLRDPDHVAVADKSSDDEYGMYALSDAFSLITPAMIGALATTSAGTAAYLDTGTAIGQVVIWQNDGSGNASLPIGTFNPDTWAGYKVNGTSVFNLGAITTGQIPVWNAATGQFDPGATGGASSLSELSDWPTAVSATEVGYLDGATSNLQAQIDALTAAFAATNAPALLSAVLGTDGETLTLGFSETVSIGAGGSGGLNVDASTTGNDIAGAYSSGDGTDTLVYTLASTVVIGETVDVDYIQPGDGVEDVGGTDLASISSFSVTNNSAVPPVNDGFVGTTALLTSAVAYEGTANYHSPFTVQVGDAGAVNQVCYRQYNVNQNMEWTRLAVWDATTGNLLASTGAPTLVSGTLYMGTLDAELTLTEGQQVWIGIASGDNDFQMGRTSEVGYIYEDATNSPYTSNTYPTTVSATTYQTTGISTYNMGVWLSNTSCAD